VVGDADRPGGGADRGGADHAPEDDH
jgi:hypothetical protein